MTEIGNDAFDEIPWLEAKRKENPLVIVNGILIDGKACAGNVVIPEGVTEIQNHAFLKCESLTTITIPKSVTEIGEDAFFSCTSLTNVHILNDRIHICRGAFAGCKNAIFPDGTDADIFNNFMSSGRGYPHFIQKDSLLLYFEIPKSELDKYLAPGEDKRIRDFLSTTDLATRETIFPDLKPASVKLQLCILLAIGYDSEVGKAYLKRNIKKVMALLTDRVDVDTISKVLELGYVTKKNFDEIFAYVNAKKGGEFTELKVILLNYKHDHIGYEDISKKFRL